jgi:hypothetical protein
VIAFSCCSSNLIPEVSLKGGSVVSGNCDTNYGKQASLKLKQNHREYILQTVKSRSKLEKNIGSLCADNVNHVAMLTGD